MHKAQFLPALLPVMLMYLGLALFKLKQISRTTYIKIVDVGLFALTGSISSSAFDSMPLIQEIILAEISVYTALRASPSLRICVRKCFSSIFS